ncbi:hypothetical protein [Petrotoga sp. 9PWA.NaAc.5.4]|uniref:hypothetical protein n=1 Tax=Petrotoga sp. 9PWA.NaAc.5.4 TaxID=1434328 RepID=UPI000CAB20C2|nr:hypothetical protein [Petrotoga sp. 9PWA.NaAc.5.4]PNR92555.1 hypothetical protein X924_09285 [Petrotoga sp. 9PWA.NaAc.5.4]
MSLKRRFITLLYFFVTLVCLYKIFFPYRLQTDIENLSSQIKNEGIIYYIKYNNRFFYFDIYDKIVLINDLPNPKFIEVIYSEDIKKRNEELNLIKKIYWLPNIIKVDFKNQEITCFNNVSIKYFEFKDIEAYLEKNNLNYLNSGNYVLIGQKLFYIDDRGL